jgi:outer membrane protein OmpA-like peptidoglycan-associated protein
MRSKIFLVLAVSGCFKSTGPEVCSPVVTSWGSPVYRCIPTPLAVPEMPPTPIAATPPPKKTEVTDDEIKLKEKVEFETDSAKLLPSSTPLLDEVVTVMKEHPDIEHVRVGGHTDSTSTAEHNLKLSDERAASVKQYLVDHGIAPARLSSKGYGQTRPIGDNKTEEGRAQNRRVEVHILRHKGDKTDKAD